MLGVIWLGPAHHEDCRENVQFNYTRSSFYNIVFFLENWHCFMKIQQLLPQYKK